LKRLLDIVGALLGLIVLSPVLLIAGVLVRLTSRGPALFRQTRVGLGGRDFTLLKLRTMTLRPGGEESAFDAGDTSRVTSLGRWLRAAKLDELPQLWNVLVGDMSLVGPRPEVRKWVKACPDRWAAIHSVKPGITDPASITYRHEEEILAAADDPERTYRQQILPRKLDLYEQYVRGHTVMGDVKIICRTIWAVIGRRRRGECSPARRPGRRKRDAAT
jgi:lipopolysaccharide/colanic/teichoic acid biosynthesis glycosyltransferase